MDRSCPKRKKTKKALKDEEVRKAVSYQETECLNKKLIKQTKVPEDWDSGFILNLYHGGYTFAVAPNPKKVGQMITYDECDFLRSIEEGHIPDLLVPLLKEMEMLSENTLLITVHDYRGFPRTGSLQPHTLDYPISKRHVLTRSAPSLVREMYDTLGEKLSLEQLHHLENYLVMANSPPLCLDPSPQVFETKCGIHRNRNMLNESAVRKLITKFTRSDIGCVPTDSTKELCDFIKTESEPSSSKERSVDAMLKKEKCPPSSAPNMLNEILELCAKRARSRAASDQAAMRQMSGQGSRPVVENHQHPEQMANHSQQVSPGGYNTPAPPQLKPAPFMTNKVPPQGVMIPPGLIAQNSPQTSQSSIPQQPASHSPKSVPPGARMPNDAMNMAGKRVGYNPGYMVPQQINKQMPQQTVQGVRVPMMTRGMMPGQQTMIRAPGAPIMNSMHMQHMQTTPDHMTQRPMTPDGTSQMKAPMQNSGMMMQYQRNYGQYHNVQTIPRGYVDQGQYIPVQQQPQQQPAPRPGQVLQISLPPNMNPHQSRPRHPGMGGMAPQQQPLHRVPYNQMQQMGGLQNPNIYNQYG